MKKFRTIGFVAMLLAGFLFLTGGTNDRFSQINLTEDNEIDLPEIVAPSGNPATNHGWVYTKDSGGGVSNLYFEADDGTVTDLVAAGNTKWNAITDPDGNGSITFGTFTNVFTGSATAANQHTIKNTGNFGDVAVLSIEQDTGNPTDGKMLQIKIADTDVDFLSLYQGSELFKITSAGVITSGAVAIDYTDFDVSADGVLTLAPDDSPADVIAISPSAAATDGLDVSDSDLVNAINVGENITLGTNWNISGAGVASFAGADVGDSNISNVGTISADLLQADAAALAIGAGTETVAVNSSDWDISTTGAMTGIGAITSDGAISTTSTFDVDGSATISDTTAGANVTLGNSTGNITAVSDNADFTLTDTTDNVFQLVNSGGAVLFDVDLGADDTITVGSGAQKFVLASSNIDISNAGAITGATGVSTSGTLASTGAFDVDGGANISDTTAGSDVTIGNSTGNVVLTTDAGDINCTDTTDNVFQISNATGPVVYFDLDLGAADALTVGNAAGTLTLASSDWAIDATGVVSGLGNIGSNGLYTFTGPLAASDAFKVDVADAWTGQALVIDAGPWLGTAGEGAGFSFISDSAATAEAGGVIRVKLQGTGADAAAIDGKALYLEDEAASTAGSYLMYVDSAFNGAAHFRQGEVIFDDAAPLMFEGATANASETRLTVDDPTADRTVALPDYSGGVPLIIANSQTQTDATGVGTATDVTGSDLSLVASWFAAGKALKWSAYGTSDGSGGAAMSLALSVDGSQFGIVELTTGQSDDWALECTLNEYTDLAHQKIMCTLMAAGEASVTEYDVDTTNMAAGATAVKLVANTNHANDHVYVESVMIEHWKK